jgi:hypothetical protein
MSSSSVSKPAVSANDGLLAIQRMIDANYELVTNVLDALPAPEAKPHFMRIADELLALSCQNDGNWIGKGLKALGSVGKETERKLSAMLVKLAPFSAQLESLNKAAAAAAATALEQSKKKAALPSAAMGGRSVVSLQPPGAQQPSAGALIGALGAPLGGPIGAAARAAPAAPVAKWIEKDLPNYGRCLLIANFEGVFIPTNKISVSGSETFAVVSTAPSGDVKRAFPSIKDAQAVVEGHWRDELTRMGPLKASSKSSTPSGRGAASPAGAKSPPLPPAGGATQPGSASVSRVVGAASAPGRVVWVQGEMIFKRAKISSAWEGLIWANYPADVAEMRLPDTSIEGFDEFCIVEGRVLRYNEETEAYDPIAERFPNVVAAKRFIESLQAKGTAGLQKAPLAEIDALDCFEAMKQMSADLYAPDLSDAKMARIGRVLDDLFKKDTGRIQELELRGAPAKTLSDIKGAFAFYQKTYALRVALKAIAPAVLLFERALRVYSPVVDKPEELETQRQTLLTQATALEKMLSGTLYLIPGAQTTREGEFWINRVRNLRQSLLRAGGALEMMIWLPRSGVGQVFGTFTQFHILPFVGGSARTPCTAVAANFLNHVLPMADHLDAIDADHLDAIVYSGKQKYAAVCQEIASRGFELPRIVQTAERTHYVGFEKYAVIKQADKWVISTPVGLYADTFTTRDKAEARLSDMCDRLPRPPKVVDPATLAYNEYFQMQQLAEVREGARTSERWDFCCPNLDYVARSESYYINGAPQAEVKNYWSYKMLDHIERVQASVGCAGKPFGCTFSTRGETSALAIVKTARGTEYVYFDSHGTHEHLGNSNSYMLRFPSKEAAAAFLDRRYAFKDLDREMGAFRKFASAQEQADANKISINFAVLKGKRPANSPALDLEAPKQVKPSSPVLVGAGAELIGVLGRPLDLKKDPKAAKDPAAGQSASPSVPNGSPSSAAPVVASGAPKPPATGVGGQADAAGLIAALGVPLHPPANGANGTSKPAAAPESGATVAGRSAPPPPPPATGVGRQADAAGLIAALGVPLHPPANGANGTSKPVAGGTAPSQHASAGMNGSVGATHGMNGFQPLAAANGAARDNGKVDRPKMAGSVLDFYRNGMPFSAQVTGRQKLKQEVTLEAILQHGERNMEAEFRQLMLSKSFFEGEHDYIQRLFPYEEAGAINLGAPVADAATVQAFKAEPKLRAQMIRALDVMLSFYGLRREVNGVVGISRDPKTFATRSPNWLVAPTRVHNHQRLDRIIRSLRLFGFEAEAMALYACLVDIAANEGKGGKISDDTLKNYWTLHALESAETIAKRVAAKK